MPWKASDLGQPFLFDISDWGEWRVDIKRFELTLDREHYDIRLVECITSAATLDWICQVAQKTWATDSDIAGMVRAINDLIYPQGKLCSFGKERGPLHPDEIRGEVEKFTSQRPESLWEGEGV